MTVKFLFAWYDLWIGLFIDTKKRRLYVFPIPCFGFYVEMQQPLAKAKVADALTTITAILQKTGPVEVSLYDLPPEPSLRITRENSSATVRYEAIAKAKGEA